MPGVECGEPGPCRRICCLILWRNGESSKQQIASQKQTLNYKRGGLSRALIAEAAVKMFEELRAPSTQPLWRKFFYSNFSLQQLCSSPWLRAGQGMAGAGQSPCFCGRGSQPCAADWCPVAGLSQALELLCWRPWSEDASSRSVFSHRRQHQGCGAHSTMGQGLPAR